MSEKMLQRFVSGWWFAYHHVMESKSITFTFMESFGLPLFCRVSGWISSSKIAVAFVSPFWSWYCKLGDKQHQRHGDHLHIHCFILWWKSIILAGINICVSFLSEFPQKRRFHLIQIDVLKDHIQKQTVRDCVFASLFYVFIRTVFASTVNKYCLTNCCYLVVLTFFTCFGYSIATFFVNGRVLFDKSVDSLQNMQKSTMISRCVWLHVNNTPFKR